MAEALVDLEEILRSLDVEVRPDNYVFAVVEAGLVGRSGRAADFATSPAR